TRGNPLLARSFTGGERSTLPVNHGLTVCWSEDATSVQWLARSEERTWLETTSSTRRSCAEGDDSKRTKPQPPNTRRPRAAATASQCLGMPARVGFRLPAPGSEAWIRLR